MKKILLICVSALVWAVSATAEVKLPAIISDNMVLQQQTDVALWGTAAPNRQVLITASWTRQKTAVTADADGKWSAKVHTPAAGGPYEIVFNDGQKTTVKNVLIGEVWFCSGQSNMEMPVKGFRGQMVNNSMETIMGAKASTPIRMCTIKRNPALTEQTECETQWFENTPEAVRDASAAAYYFAKQVNETLGIPVGIVISDWGGTPIESWMSRKVLSSQFPEFDLSFLDGATAPDRVQFMACSLFNGMVAPIIPYTIKGMIWYQGESNIGRAEQYLRLQPAYVQMMRDLWGNQEMPFYFVQIAPYRYGDPDATGSPILQEAQYKSLAKIPHSGMATTLDIGNEYIIHPQYKPEVGKRLAMLALVHDYGMKGICPDSPTFKNAEFKDGKATVTFDNVGDLGLAPMGSALEGFELAGEDKVFHKATGRVDVDKIVVSSPEVAAPVAVRYAFHNIAKATLFNGYGVPAGPFRSDNWEK